MNKNDIFLKEQFNRQPAFNKIEPFSDEEDGRDNVLMEKITTALNDHFSENGFYVGEFTSGYGTNYLSIFKNQKEYGHWCDDKLNDDSLFKIRIGDHTTPSQHIGKYAHTPADCDIRKPSMVLDAINGVYDTFNMTKPKFITEKLIENQKTQQVIDKYKNINNLVINKKNFIDQELSKIAMQDKHVVLEVNKFNDKINGIMENDKDADGNFCRPKRTTNYLKSLRKKRGYIVKDKIKELLSTHFIKEQAEIKKMELELKNLIPPPKLSAKQRLKNRRAKEGAARSR